MWGKITNIFNASNSVHRTTKTLKQKYETLKENLRKKISENKNQIYMTGGGCETEIKQTDFEEKLYAVIKINVEGLQPRSDSDFIVLGK